MTSHEGGHILAAVLILFMVLGLPLIILGQYAMLVYAFISAALIILVHVFVKKWIAYSLDAGVEHRIWEVSQWGWKQKEHFSKPVPAGLIVPLVLSLFSAVFLSVAGMWLYFMGIITYETRALKYRASRRFGIFSYTEMSEWHNAVIGAAGIVGILIVALVAYFFNFEYLAKVAGFYAFFNMLPISNLDGTQIFFGSRILWAVLMFLAVVFALTGIVISTLAVA